jgi:hypothetical protein
MIRDTISTLLAALLIAAATWAVGWWAVPIIGAVHGLAGQIRTAVEWKAAAAGAIGWGALLAIQAFGGDFGSTATALGGVFGMSGTLLVVLTLSFAAILAGSAAGVARGIASLVGRKRSTSEGQPDQDLAGGDLTLEPRV